MGLAITANILNLGKLNIYALPDWTEQTGSLSRVNPGFP